MSIHMYSSPVYVGTGTATPTTEKGAGGSDSDESFADGQKGQLPQRRKSKRTTQACDSCHKNKKKCDGANPCGNCTKAQRDCLYTRMQKRRESRAAYVSALEQRLMQIEGMLAGQGVAHDLVPKELPDFSSPMSMTTSFSTPITTTSPVALQTDFDLTSIFPAESVPNVALQLNSVQDRPHLLSDITILQDFLNLETQLLAPQPGIKRKHDGTEISQDISRSSSPGNRVTALGQVGNRMSRTRRASPKVDEVALAVIDMATVIQTNSDLPNVQPEQALEAETDGEQVIITGGEELTPRELAKLATQPSAETLAVMNRLVPHEPPRRDLVALYFNHLTIWAPWAHVPLFLRDLDSQNPLLLNSMYAMAMRLLTPPPDTIPNNIMALDILETPEGVELDSEVYFARAKRLVACSLDEPCLSSIVALLTMALYAGGVGRPSSAWMYSGMAVRMAHEMRIHQIPTPNMLKSMTPLVREIRNRIWWCCFLLDTCNSAVADRPPFIVPEETTIDLPNDDFWNQLDDEGNPLPGVGNTLNMHFPSKGFREYVHLLTIFSKVLRFVRSRVPGQDDEEQIRLQTNLNEWFTSLPNDLKIVASVGDLNRIEFARVYGAAHLHIVYHTSCILLHRPQLTLNNFEWPSDESFESCTFAAFSINSILAPLIEMDPTVQYMNPFLTFCVFESGMIHLVNGMLGAKAPKSKLITNQLQLQGLKGEYHKMMTTMCKSAIELHLSCLDRLKHYWVAAEAYFLTLGRLATEQEIVDDAKWVEKFNTLN